jgi:uncharacterized protein (TIGR02246 family)
MDVRRQQITDLVDEVVRTQSDPDAFLPCHDDDVVIVNIAGRRVLGRDALESAMRQALASPLADVTTTVVVDDIRFVRDDVAIVSCTKTVHDGRAETTGDSDPLPSVGAMTYVMVEGDDGWGIALAQTTPVR